MRLCGEPGPEEEEEGEEDSGPEGDGEEEPLLRASGRGRRAGAARDKEPRVGAGTAAAAGLARGERRGAPGVCPEGWMDGRTDGQARPDLAQPSPARWVGRTCRAEVLAARNARCFRRPPVPRGEPADGAGRRGTCGAAELVRVSVSLPAAAEPCSCRSVLLRLSLGLSLYTVKVLTARLRAAAASSGFGAFFRTTLKAL